MKQVTAVLENWGQPLEEDFKIPDLLDAETTIRNILTTRNQREQVCYKFVRLKKARNRNG